MHCYNARVSLNYLPRIDRCLAVLPNKDYAQPTVVTQKTDGYAVHIHHELCARSFNYPKTEGS